MIFLASLSIKRSYNIFLLKLGSHEAINGLSGDNFPTIFDDNFKNICH